LKLGVTPPTQETPSEEDKVDVPMEEVAKVAKVTKVAKAAKVAKEVSNVKEGNNTKKDDRKLKLIQSNSLEYDNTLREIGRKLG